MSKERKMYHYRPLKTNANII